MSLAICLHAFLITVAMTIVLIKIPFIKRKEEDRWSKKEVPTLGGIALFIAMLPMFVNCSIETQYIDELLTGAALIFLCGLLDDIVIYKAYLKFYFQFIVAILLTNCVILPNFISYALFFIFALTMVNATNFLDNMDAICALSSGVAALSIYMITNDSCCFYIVGACFGFLLFNVSGKIYMGDCGSMFLGYSLSFITLLHIEYILYILIASAVPLIDITYVVLHRVSLGKKPWVGGTDHISHVIARRYNENIVALVYLTASLGFGCIGYIAKRMFCI